MSVPESEQRKLHQRSGNRCAFPDCRVILTVAATSDDRMAVLGENAHIVAAKPDGPRGDSPLTEVDRNRYENLILLCNNHHQQIDSQPDSYPVDKLHEWKANHERWVEESLGGESTPNIPVAETPYLLLGRDNYLQAAIRSSKQRRRQQRFGAGLNDVQVERSLGHPVHIPKELCGLAAGEVRVLVGPLGSGKSDVAEEWHQAALAAACANLTAPIPVWLASRALHKTMEDYLIGEVGREALYTCGVDLVVDGLDEHPEGAVRLLTEARALIDRWPKARILLTSRSIKEASPVREIPTQLLGDTDARWLMGAIAGSRMPPLSDHLVEAARRPLFALLIARHASAAEGATGIPELVDRVVDDVVDREGYDLYPELKRLAVETIRDAKPVDPARFTTGDVAARVRGSSIVTKTGRACAFSLATFEQWFAAKAILEGDVDLDEELTSLEAFDKWRYVLAIVLAAGDPVRADAAMDRLARWNPGAAAWVIRETHAGGLTRTNPDYDSTDWARIGGRLRYAAEAWMSGLGPLALATFPAQVTGTTSLDRIALAVDVDAWSLRISWLVRDELPEKPLDMVISLANSSPIALDRTISMRTHAIATGPNWVWETMQDHLAADIGNRLAVVADKVAADRGGVLHDELRDTKDSLYPGPDFGTSHASQSYQYRAETILARTEAVMAAAMTCYLELVADLAPNFGDTLGIRGLMPVEFYGDLHYSEPGTGGVDFWGPSEPTLAWLMKPIRSPGSAVQDRTNISNSVSLTLNDQDRDAELRHDFERFHTWHNQRVHDRPAYEPFEASFATHFGRFGVLGARPATRLALRWLWDDLKRLGWVRGTIAPRFHR